MGKNLVGSYVLFFSKKCKNIYPATTNPPNNPNKIPVAKECTDILFTPYVFVIDYF